MTHGAPVSPGTRVAYGSMHVGARLGEGGQGAVFATDCTFAGRPLVYKEYSPGPRSAIDPDVLEDMTRVVAQLGDADRGQILNTFAWPIALVTDGDTVTGFLMPAVPDAYYGLRGRGNKKMLRLNEFQHLLNPPEFIARLGIQLSRRAQLRLLIAVAEALTLLHRNRFAVGDLSPKNMMFDAGTGQAYFVDCDAMAHGGRTVLPQAETPGWDLPHGEASGTEAGDSYKFALLALRLLSGDQDTRDPERMPVAVDSVRPLAARGLTEPADRRPRPGDWIPSLTVAAAQASTDALDGNADRTDAYSARAQTIPDAPGVTHRPTAHATPTQGFGPVGQPFSAAPPPPPGLFTRMQAWPAPGSPAPTPAKRGSAAPAILAGIVAVALIAGGIGWLVSRDGPQENRAEASPGTSSAHVQEPPSSSPPPISSSTPVTTPPRPAATAPAGSTGERCGTTPFTVDKVHLTVTVGDTVPATHCNFAMVVAHDVNESSDTSWPITVNSRSPNTQNIYRMNCDNTSSNPIIVRCHDGSTAEVYFYY